MAEAENLQQFEEMVVTYEILAKDFPGLTEELVNVVMHEHKDKIQVQVPDDIGKAVEVVKAEFQEKLKAQKEDLPMVVLQTLGEFRNDVAAQERTKLLETLDPVLDRNALEEVGRVLARRGVMVPDEYKGRFKDLESARDAQKARADEAVGKLEDLQGDTAILSKLGMQASMMIAAERRLGGKDYREAVLGMIGNPDKYESRESFSEALDKACEEFDKKDKQQDDLKTKVTQDQLENERREHREKVAGLEKKLGDIEKANAKEIEELNQSHEIIVSELKADVERVRSERMDATDKLSKAISSYEGLVREAKRFERESNDDEEKLERKVTDVERRNDKLKFKADAAERRVDIERMLMGRPDAESLRPLLKNVNSVEEAADIIAQAVTSSSTPNTSPSSIAEAIGLDTKRPTARGVQVVDRGEEESEDVGQALEEEFEQLGVKPEDILDRMPPSGQPENGGQQ